MSRVPGLIAVLSGTLVLQACSLGSPGTSSSPPSLPGIEPLPVSATQTGTDIQVSLQGTTYETQYVSGDIQELLIGLYDTNPGNPVDPDSSRNFAFSIGGWLKTDNAAASRFAGVEYPVPYFDDVRYLVGQDIDDPTHRLQNGRYMIRRLTKAGGGFTSPTVHEAVTFYNIPDGNYKVFAVAVKNQSLIGRDVKPLAFNASDRVFYSGRSGRSYLPPHRVPVLCLRLDPNPDLTSHVGISDDGSTPNFGPP